MRDRERERFVKLLGLTRSSNDGEALAALRKCNDVLTQHHLRLAGMGTGAGWVVHKLRLSDPNPETRRRARDFAAAIIDLAGGFGAPAILGSMQGRWEGSLTRDQALGWLAEALEQLAPRAHGRSRLTLAWRTFDSPLGLKHRAAVLVAFGPVLERDLRFNTDLAH